MIGPTRPLRSLPLSGILAIAGTLATLSVVAVPRPDISTLSAEATATGHATAATTAMVDSPPLDGVENIHAVGREVGVVFSAVEAIAATAVN